MMEVTVFLLFAVLIPVQYTSAQTCDINNAIDLKIKAAIDSLASTIKPSCTSVSSLGADVTCPSGYTAVSCSCGMGCGSWDIRGDNGCHCQCARIDWTSARCCKVG